MCGKYHLIPFIFFVITSSSNRSHSSPSVRWSEIQSVFGKCESDVLFLFDCCAAASAAPAGGQGLIESIVAGGFESTAPGPGPHSFTNALIEVLHDWSSKLCFSAASLHGQILNDLMSIRPERSREAGGKRVEVCTTPIYIAPRNDPKFKSILISPRPLPVEVDATAHTAAAGLPSVRPATLPSSNVFDTTTLNNKMPSGLFDIPHVLLSVALESD